MAKIPNNFTWDTVQDLVRALSPADGQDGYALVADPTSKSGLSFKQIQAGSSDNPQADANTVTLTGGNAGQG